MHLLRFVSLMEYKGKALTEHVATLGPQYSRGMICQLVGKVTEVGKPPSQQSQVKFPPPLPGHSYKTGYALRYPLSVLLLWGKEAVWR